MSVSLEDEFLKATLEICKRSGNDIDYHPRVFLDMVAMNGAVDAAEQLISAPQPADGFTRLWESQRLDLSIEALVVENPKFHSLFTPAEIARATQRLTDYRYQPTVRR